MFNQKLLFFFIVARVACAVSYRQLHLLKELEVSKRSHQTMATRKDILSFDMYYGINNQITCLLNVIHKARREHKYVLWPRKRRKFDLDYIDDLFNTSVFRKKYFIIDKHTDKTQQQYHYKNAFYDHVRIYDSNYSAFKGECLSLLFKTPIHHFKSILNLLQQQHPYVHFHGIHYRSLLNPLKTKWTTHLRQTEQTQHLLQRQFHVNDTTIRRWSRYHNFTQLPLFISGDVGFRTLAIALIKKKNKVFWITEEMFNLEHSQRIITNGDRTSSLMGILLDMMFFKSSLMFFGNDASTLSMNVVHWRRFDGQKYDNLLGPIL